MALHIVRNKTSKMFYLPGDFITDVFNRVWGYQGSRSKQIHGHIKIPVSYFFSTPLCLIHLKTSFFHSGKEIAMVSGLTSSHRKQCMTSTVLCEEDLLSFLEAITKLPFVSYWWLLISPRPETCPHATSCYSNSSGPTMKLRLTPSL